MTKKQTPQHIPVLLEEVLQLTPPAKEGRIYWGIDGTFGRGGHAIALLNKYNTYKVLGVDRDHEAHEYAGQNYVNELASGRMILLRENFHNFARIKEYFLQYSEGGLADYILLDLGVSSPQLDKGDRGFSFYHDGPLDMRMDQRQPLSAQTIINEWSESELEGVFRDLGEVRRPMRVVKAIIEDREQEPFTTTGRLAEMIARIEGWRKKGFHPATQYFMGLRLAVNNELDGLKVVLPEMIQALRPGGRLLVITFHSLEDRIVKWCLKEHLNEGFLVNKKVIQADWNEKKKNTRARSAKLRVFERESR